jgi:acyl carrier protein
VHRTGDSLGSQSFEKEEARMTTDEIFARIKDLIVELLEIDEDEIKPAASFMDDFGADSLDIIELLTAVEEAFKIEIPDEDAGKLQTVQNAMDYVAAKLA